MKQEIGKALLVVFMEPEAGTEAEFNEWYNRYHVPERVSVPGILGARRYEICEGEGAIKYLAIYELEDEGVLHGEAYLKKAAESTPMSFKRPKGLKDNETFYIKCQVATEADAMNFHAPIDAPTHPHVIYDRTRSVAFFMMPGTPGHKELFESVKKERAFEGKKAFFKATYDSSGNMKVFPHTACAKKW